MNKYIWIASLTLAMTISFHAYAKDKKEEAKNLNDIIAETALEEGEFRYAPKECDFEITFPEAPHTAKRCPNGPKSCTTLTSYTMVYDVTATIEVSMTCVASTPAKYKDYSEKVIRMALNGMVKRGNVTDHEINATQEENYRMGSLLGTATRGKQNSIYNAQILVGQNSIMTVESKLIGPAHEKADKVFADILSSIKKQAD